MVTAYRWQLRRGSAKEVCPQCGQRRFVPYVATADGTTIATDDAGRMIYGRCDREDNCGYSLYPNGVHTAVGVQVVERKPEQPLRFSPAAVVVDKTTNLYTYAAGLFGAEKATRAWEMYKIGRDGARTVFWQIAADGTIRAGKSIPYMPNGHRDKSDKYPANWLHKSRFWDGYKSGTELQQCFFGEHLLKQFPDKRVVVVESEKTAALMSVVSNCLWLACGGSQMLKNAERNKVLAGREVCLLPDNGQYWNWRAVADRNGWNIFDQLDIAPLFEGCDILDLVEKHIQLKRAGHDGLF